MLTFLQPSQMENDQIYKLSLRPFYQRINHIINTIEKTGEVSVDVLMTLKESLNNQVFLTSIFSPGLNYFAIDLTTYVSNGLSYKLDETDLINKLMTSGNIQKFISYFILPCAKNGIEIETVVLSSSDGVIELPGLNYVINTPEKNTFHLISTHENKITINFSKGKEIVAEILINKSSSPFLKNEEFSIEKNSLNTIDGISLTFSDPLISKCLTNNFRDLNVRKSNENNLISNIEFTLNDHLYYKSCLELIAEIWPEYYKEITSHIKLIAIMDTDAFGGFTANLLPDAIFLSHHPNDFLWVTENIVHECAHSRLEQLFVIDPVVLNEQTEKFKSPWREDPRPMKGVYHGVFAFTRVAMWLERLYKMYPVASISDRLELVLQQLEQGMAVISQSGKLSPIGEHLFNEARSIVYKNKKLEETT